MLLGDWNCLRGRTGEDEDGRGGVGEVEGWGEEGGFGDVAVREVEWGEECGGC